MAEVTIKLVCKRDGLKAAAKTSTRVRDDIPWVHGTCDVCGHITQVTQPKFFGNPSFPRRHSK